MNERLMAAKFYARFFLLLTLFWQAGVVHHFLHTEHTLLEDGRVVKAKESSCSKSCSASDSTSDSTSHEHGNEHGHGQPMGCEYISSITSLFTSPPCPKIVKSIDSIVIFIVKEEKSSYKSQYRIYRLAPSNSPPFWA